MMGLKPIVTEEETQGEFVKPPEIHEEEPKKERQLMINSKQLIRVVGMLVARFKCKTPEQKEKFIEEYTSLNETILGLIGFDEALQEMPIPEMNPTMVVGVGVAILIGTAIMLPAPKVEEPEKTESKEQTEEGKKELPKFESQEELMEYVKYVEENEEEGKA